MGVNVCPYTSTCGLRNEVIEITGAFRTLRCWDTPSLLPAIIQVCRQLREESGLVFYAVNEFAVCLGRTRDGKKPPGLHTLRKWVETIGVNNTKGLRRLHVHYTSGVDKRRLLSMDLVSRECLNFRFLGDGTEVRVEEKWI